MKHCSSCKKVYQDDIRFCYDDGTTLSDGVMNIEEKAIDAKHAISIDSQASSPATFSGNQAALTKKWPFLIIGLLIAALGVMAVLLARQQWDIVPATDSTLRESVSEPDPNVPNIMISDRIPPSRADIQSKDASDLPVGRWSGDWSTSTGAYLTINLYLSENGTGKVDGRVEWTLQRTTRSDKMSKIGMSATEYVRGQFDPTTRLLTMTGYRKEDPNDVLVMLDSYRLNLSPDGRHLNGAARNGGKWNGRVKLGR